MQETSVQVALVCEQLRQIPELQGGYNAVGFSQGTLGYGRRLCTLYPACLPDGTVTLAERQHVLQA